MVLVDSVRERYRNGSILEVVDPRLTGKFDTEEITLILQLGLLCSHPLPNERPSMRKVMQYLDCGKCIPDLSSTLALMQTEGSDLHVMSFSPETSIGVVSCGSSATVLAEGR